MDTISLKGEIYIKGSKIAEDLGYTSDYVGQLCRSGQVAATLVGRSWYVSEESIRKHKKSRYRTNQAKSVNEVRKIITERNESEGVVSKNQFTSAVYEEDEQPLRPLITKSVVNEPKNDDEEYKVVLTRHDSASKPALNVENDHSIRPKMTVNEPILHRSSHHVGQTPIETVSFIPLKYQEGPTASSGSLPKVFASAVIALGILLMFIFIGLEQQSFVSRVMPQDTYYQFDIKNGLQAAVALWSSGS